jgi:hypothetical protein
LERANVSRIAARTDRRSERLQRETNNNETQKTPRREREREREREEEDGKNEAR